MSKVLLSVAIFGVATIAAGAILAKTEPELFEELKSKFPCPCKANKDTDTAEDQDIDKDSIE